LNKYKLLTASYEKSIELYKSNEELIDRKTKLLLDQNDKLYEMLNKERSRSNWEKIIWFSLGFLSVGMGVYGVKEITK
jgi:hypothetical protein